MNPDARRLSAAQLLCTAVAFLAVGTLVAVIDVLGAAWLAGAVAGACAAAVIAQRHARHRYPRAVVSVPAGASAGPPAAAPAGVSAGPPAVAPAGVSAGPPAAAPAGVSAGPPAAAPAGVSAGPPAAAPAGVSAGPPAAAPAAARTAGAPPRHEAARATAAALATLEPSGWRAVHDVSWPYGTYDHIAIGRGGVILVANRRVDGDEPLDVIRHRVLADAAIIRQEMRRRAGRPFWVQALIVVWSDFPEGCVVDGRCVLVHGSRLAGWLERRPPQLRDDDIEVAFAAVAALAGAASTARAA